MSRPQTRRWSRNTQPARRSDLAATIWLALAAVTFGAVLILAAALLGVW